MSYLRPLASLSSLLAIERRSALNSQRADVVGSFLRILGINHDNIRSLRRHQNEIWMRDLVSFAAYSANFVGHKRYSVIEFANGFDYHE
jgi:hypothetical protein